MALTNEFFIEQISSLETQYTQIKTETKQLINQTEVNRLKVQATIGALNAIKYAFEMHKIESQPIPPEVPAATIPANLTEAPLINES